MGPTKLDRAKHERWELELEQGGRTRRRKRMSEMSEVMKEGSQNWGLKRLCWTLTPSPPRGLWDQGVEDGCRIELGGSRPGEVRT